MSVGKEKNGTYTVQCWYREQLTGERHKKTKRGFKKKSDAVRWERDFLMKAADSPTMKFADYCEVYKSDMLPRLKRNTWRTKEYIIRDKILPYFGEKRLCDIMPADVLEWQTRLMARTDPKMGKRYKKTYLRTVNNVLSGMLNHAVRFYGLPVSPMAKTGKIGSAKAEEMNFWTKDEYLKFSEEVMDKPASFAIFELLYWCGIREGEALALMPEDFDFGKGLLKITKSYQRIDRQDVITSPKTAKSVRTPTSQSVYSADYEDMGAFKAFADERDVAMVVVHHTRKMGDGDVFNTISGSNGLMGCADETMVLRRKARGRAPISRVCAVESRHVYEMGYLLEMACKAACLTLRHRYCPRDLRGVNPWFNYF